MAKQKKLVVEDLHATSNKWTSDLSRREMKPTVLTLFDIVKAYDKIRDSDIKAPILMPYPTQFMVEELGELYMQAENVASQIKSAAHNPLIKNNDEAFDGCKEALRQTIVIRKAVKKIARALDQSVITDEEDEERNLDDAEDDTARNMGANPN